MKRPTSDSWSYYRRGGRFALVELTPMSVRLTEGKVGTAGRVATLPIGRRATLAQTYAEATAQLHKSIGPPQPLPGARAAAPAKRPLALDPALPPALRARSEVWRPSAPAMIIDGDLAAAGNVVIGTGKHDHGAVIVLGAVRCASLEVSAGFAFACTGELTATGTIVAAAPDIAVYVGGKVRCAQLISGEHGWLEVHDAAQLRGVPISGYAMVGTRPTKVTRTRS